MNITKPITPDIPDRVAEALRLLIHCCQGEGRPLAGTLRTLDRTSRGILVLPSELSASADQRMLTEQEWVEIFYQTFKRAERLAESEAKYVLGSSDRGARA